MGIKGLNVTLKRYCPKAIVEIPMIELKGKRVAVDALQMVFCQASVVYRRNVLSMKNHFDEVDRTKLVEDIIARLIDFNIELLINGTVPVWCWDGKAPKEKEKTREQRREMRKRNNEKLIKLKTDLLSKSSLSSSNDDLEQLKRAVLNNFSLSFDEINKIRTVLEKTGVPNLTAEGEGEKLASFLAKEGHVDYVWSSDTDSLLLGAPKLIIGSSNGDKLKVIVLETILTSLSEVVGWDFTLEHFIDLGILHGTDFNDNIKGIGPIKSLELIKEHKTIDNMACKINIELLNHKSVRELFKYSPTNIDGDTLFIDYDAVENVENHKLKSISKLLREQDLNGVIRETYKERFF
ncbi:MAG: endonuclease [Patescibacteria group bacterium]|nr:MAG: endonuclease [Patescibacteria group bacterium]